MIIEMKNSKKILHTLKRFVKAASSEGLDDANIYIGELPWSVG